jgi:hypothetical protein
MNIAPVSKITPQSTESTVSSALSSSEILESEKPVAIKSAAHSVNRQSKSSIKIGRKIRQHMTTP